MRYATPEEEAEWSKKIGKQNQRLLWFLLGLTMLFPMWHVYTAAQRDNILEAVVRHMIKGKSNTTIFLKIDGADPSDAFLRRFQNDPFVVRKASQAVDKTPLGLQRAAPPAVTPPPGIVLLDSVSEKRGAGVDVSLSRIVLYGPFYARADTFWTSFTVIRTLRGWTVSGSRVLAVA